MAFQALKYRAYTPHSLHKLPQFQRLDPEIQHAVRVVSAVFPFRTNPYMVDELIDWDNVPDDPLFQLNFPQRDMLSPEDFATVERLLESETSREVVAATVNTIRCQHNPHPAGQMEYNVPQVNGHKLPGVQHKYAETVLFFPQHGQTCHAYCTYCFRWAQFVGMEELKFASREVEDLIDYLALRPRVTDILFTGGDPAVMKTKVLERYIEPLLAAPLSHLHNIRIGTKSLSYWPQRFVTDDDADDLLRLFERVIKSGRHVAIMAHFTHPRELSTPIVREAIRRLRDTGCEIRMQAPLIRHVNDSADLWAENWREGVKLGLVPYYMFVCRDTGPQNYFEVPLAEAYQIYRDAYAQVSGLGRTVRGPVMSATPGKVWVQGTTTINNHQYFVLSFLQARDPAWVGKPFFARYDAAASWVTQLKPRIGDRFFFEKSSPAAYRREINVPHVPQQPTLIN